MIASLFFFYSLFTGKKQHENHLFVYAFGINKKHFHLLKIFAILVFFQVPPVIAYIHIAHKENRGMLHICLALIILLCFFVMPKNIFMGNEFFSATFVCLKIVGKVSTLCIQSNI